MPASDVRTPSTPLTVNLQRLEREPWVPCPGPQGPAVIQSATLYAHKFAPPSQAALMEWSISFYLGGLAAGRLKVTRVCASMRAAPPTWHAGGISRLPLLVACIKLYPSPPMCRSTLHAEVVIPSATITVARLHGYAPYDAHTLKACDITACPLQPGHNELADNFVALPDMPVVGGCGCCCMGAGHDK